MLVILLRPPMRIDGSSGLECNAGIRSLSIVTHSLLIRITSTVLVASLRETKEL
jgi:hypothetical protein